MVAYCAVPHMLTLRRAVLRAIVFRKLETKFKGVAVPRTVYYSRGVMNQVAAAQVDIE